MKNNFVLFQSKINALEELFLHKKPHILNICGKDL